jgi:hypothetical protein
MTSDDAPVDITHVSAPNSSLYHHGAYSLQSKSGWITLRTDW